MKKSDAAGRARKGSKEQSLAFSLAPIDVRGRRKTLKRRSKHEKHWSLPESLLQELTHARPFAPPLEHGSALRESGALVFRQIKRRAPEIMLISTKKLKKWGIPKGRIPAHLSFAENAAKEAYEEAGVVGFVVTDAVAMYRDTKRSANPQLRIIMEVWVYLLEATATLSRWPERHKRVVKWVPCEAAAILLRQPVLAQLCLRLGQSHSPE
ncbi:MAG: NUDIX hydrolase [Alphaproteobacteria bacterium]|nr:NUDIX hydrolase [Alphaproteobacteria bacterium]